VRFAIDARPALDPRRTGVGHYARQMVSHLPAALAPDETVAWYLHARGLLTREPLFAGTGAVEHPSRFPARVFQPVSWRLGIPRLEWLLRFDALLATNFLPPPTRSPGVVLVVHDLAYEVMPETAPHHDDRWRRRFDAWLGRSAAVIVPSESTKADLLARHRIDATQVHVVAHGTEPFDRPDAAEIERVLARFRLDGAYVLFLGGIEPRKNLSGLVRGFSSLGDVDARLVIAGGRTNWIPHAADQLRAEVAALPESVGRRIVFTGYVAGLDKRVLLASAAALAYPSSYEGFGFPVLEGFAAGVPVLTSTASSLPEVAGEAAISVDPGDVDAIADGLRRLLEDGALRQQLVAAGRDRVRRFTWERSAAATAEVLRAAARR
jgi:glycosyltransferase involved in cell wall biosynthesis